MKTKFMPQVAWSIAALIASVGLFMVGYSHGHSDGVMSATATSATQLRKLHSQWAAIPPQEARNELLRMADHSLMLNAETYRLGPWLSGLLVDRRANYEIMQRYAQYREKQSVESASDDAVLKYALKTFSN